MFHDINYDRHMHANAHACSISNFELHMRLHGTVHKHHTCALMHKNAFRPYAHNNMHMHISSRIPIWAFEEEEVPGCVFLTLSVIMQSSNCTEFQQQFLGSDLIVKGIKL